MWLLRQGFRTDAEHDGEVLFSSMYGDGEILAEPEAQGVRGMREGLQAETRKQYCVLAGMQRKAHQRGDEREAQEDLPCVPEGVS